MTQALRDTALQAREAGNPARAVQAWHALLDHHPDDWRLALELKRDLKAGHHYPDADPRFRRAARALPDEHWLDHYAALYAFHGSDLAAIDARAYALLSRWPDEPRLHAIRGDVARQRRDWQGAADHFGTAARLDPAHPDHPARAAEARLHARLTPPTRPGPAPRAEYALLVLNLDRNSERMTEIERHYAASAPAWTRLPGIDGARLSAAAVARLAADPAAPRGTLGCFLSHAAAWEALLSSPHDHALVVEDDTIPLLDLPPTLDGLGLPKGWDLAFVNDRLAPRLTRGPDPDGVPGFTAAPLAHAMQLFHPDDNAPGADGYLLTRRAAAALLDWTRADGFAHDVDWRLLAYSLSAAAIAAIPEGHARTELTRLSTHIPRTGRLHACTVHPPLIRTVGVSSDREDVNRGE